MKKLQLALFIVIPLLNFGQANKLYRKALRTSNLNEKISILTQVIDLAPKNLDAYFQRGIAKNDLGDYHGAIVDYSKIIITEPDADTYYNRGNSRYSIKDFTGAKEDYAKALVIDENFIDALYSLGCVKYDLGEYNKAIKDFTSVIKLTQNSPKTYLFRALAYKALKQFTNALNDYSTAILIEPNANNYYNRGVFLMDIKYYKEAKSDLTTSLRLNNKNAYAYFYRGAANQFLGLHNDAIIDFSKAIEYDATDFDAYLGLAMAYLKTDNINKAKLNFKRANDILSIGANLNNIKEYNTTYWFQNQYFYFNNRINELVKLK